MKLVGEGSLINGPTAFSFLMLTVLGVQDNFYIFTESAHWADSVIESPCPSVCLFVCENFKHSLPEVLETSGRIAYL